MSVRQVTCSMKGSAMAEYDEKRSYRRVPLRLPVRTLLNPDGGESFELFTANVSAGGMLVRMPAQAAPDCGQNLRFELSVPPGEGYSVAPCRISGQGKVVRTDPGNTDQCEVAVRFTNRLSLGV